MSYGVSTETPLEDRVTTQNVFNRRDDCSCPMDSRKKSPGVSFSSEKEIANRYDVTREGKFRREHVKIRGKIEFEKL
jgi:hypothetical protein